ncbi:YraN family protein [Mameliella sp. CS4]|uniref:YraN family protein n=1 Tax=Mameliella sp. CS4 TaxID=2862329 RepID=UPI001C5F5169|nr:YraN family protein [Mameliella sp. CS4]MBW4984655.1 YraN family protein [Mameliella sp. CS4]
MALDFAGVAGRVDTGRCGYHAGLAAEIGVAADYARRGYPLLARRWRGRSGEIDLVLRDGDGVIVVEVKKSRNFDRAVERLSQRQIGRLLRAGEEFLGTMPRGSLTDIRFDVALVNGHGEIRVIENALC